MFLWLVNKKSYVRTRSVRMEHSHTKVRGINTERKKNQEERTPITQIHKFM